MKFILSALGMMLWGFTAFAQTSDVSLSGNAVKSATLLPDISVIGDMKGNWYSRNNDSLGGFSVDEIELSFQGYLYPQIRADVFTSLHKDGEEFAIEVEEAYLTFSGLAENVGVKLGRKHLNFGKQNVLHPEQWRLIDAPVVVQNFLGEESLSPEGASVDYLLPLPWFMQVELGSWKASSPTDPSSETAFSPVSTMTHARLWTSWEDSWGGELELGASGLWGKGPLYQSETDTFSLWGVDATYKLWPDTLSRWMLQTEAMFLNRSLASQLLNRWGGYVYLGYQWDRDWEWGVRGDYAQSAQESGASSEKLSLLISDRLTETTKARVQYTYDTDTGDSQITMQLLFGLGPHSHVLQ